MARHPNRSPRTLDSFDRAILRILQEDNKKPQRSISEQVNLSAASVQRRITAMEDEGIISRNVAEIDRDKLGLTITSIVEVDLVNEHAATVDAVKQVFKATPEVQQCYYVTGGLSFILVIVTTDMRAYETLVQWLFAENPHVRYYRSILALDRVKVGSNLIIP